MQEELALPLLLSVSRERIHDLESASRLEWIEADGKGGWAAGTVPGVNTRGTHGLVVAARRPPADRVVLLSRLEETIITEAGERLDLGAAFYPDAVHPEGFRFLECFLLDPWPVWRYRIGEGELVRELFHAHGPRVTVLRYRLRGGAASLEMRPLFAGRPLDARCTARDDVRRDAEASERLVAYQPRDDAPSVIISFADGDWTADGIWYYRARYPADARHGQPDTEDLYSPGFLRVPLAPDRNTVVAFGLVPARVARAKLWASDELRRREILAASGRRLAPADARLSEMAARLALAADAFRVDRGYGTGIVAAQPGRMDRGRDALIALHGLDLAPRRLDDAARVLRTFAANLRDGLVPDRFPEDGGRIPDDHYAAADTSLWFIQAVAALHEAGGDARDLWPAVREVLRAYQTGAAFGIRLDTDGLVRHGATDVALTWMDAIGRSRPVNLRAGKAVEVNALWYDALLRAAQLPWAQNPAYLRELAARCASAFATFWFPQGGYLFDVIDPGGRPDPALRPNQLLALSLPFTPLERERARSVLRAVERELLLPCGLRSLAPGHPAYRGRLDADDASAVVNGGAWPWLMGPFAAAYLRLHDGDAASRARVRDLLLRFEPLLSENGLGQIGEVYGGDPPHAPGRCFAHAAAVGELMRAMSLLS